MVTGVLSGFRTTRLQQMNIINLSPLGFQLSINARAEASHRVKFTVKGKAYTVNSFPKMTINFCL